MSRQSRILALCIAFGMLGLLHVQRAEAKDPETKDGIPGTVVKVDVNAQTVTIAEQGGRERTYSITQETTIVGPRGGVVRSRLKDHRFHSGLPITVVADGKTALELHLGYDRKAREAAGSAVRSRTLRTPRPESDSSTSDSGSSAPSSSPTSTPSSTRTSRFRGPADSKRAADKEAAKDEEEDEDNEFPGKVKTVEPNRHLLVITLVNGKDRSFLLASSAKIMVNSHESRLGLSDSAFKPGMPVTVITETGGRKVKEVKLTTAATRRLRRAG
jgi:hypothetical protein